MPEGTGSATVGYASQGAPLEKCEEPGPTPQAHFGFSLNITPIFIR